MLNSEHTTKITVSFVLILGLMLIMIIFDLSRLNLMQEKLDSIVKEHAVKTSLMLSIRSGIYERQVSLRNILLMNDFFERDAGRQVFNSFAVKIISARNNFSKMKLNAEEARVLKEINESMAIAYQAQVNLIDKSIYNENITITQEELRSTFLTQEDFIQKLEKMINLQTSATEMAVMDAEKSYNEASNSAYILGGSALLIGSLVAFFIIRLTSFQERSVNSVMYELQGSREKLEDRVKQRTGELAFARDEALASNKAKDAFLAVMSHELRTPLNIIVGYSELLEEMAEELDTKSLVKDLRKIQIAANHQLKLINSLLDISKIEEGKFEIHVDYFDVESLLTEVNETIPALMLKNKNEFKIDCDFGIGMMLSDYMRVLQILLNILGNAAKFTFEGSVTLKIFKEHKGSVDDIIFQVTDTGVGISKEYIAHLFDEFTQEDNTSTRTYSGTGLGLSISKKLAKLLNGDITVKSEKNMGSTFFVRLPVSSTP